jgi:hypothetical protein
MFSVDENKTRRWLNLTQQEYDIVKAIYRLRNRGIQPTPKNIQKEYLNAHGKHIIKPNLFNLLRQLQAKKAVSKPAQAEYAVNEEGIKEVLEEARKHLAQDIEDVEKTRDQVDQYFKETTYRKEQPDIHFLQGVQLSQTMAEYLQTAKTVHIVADFPQTAYNQEMTLKLQMEPYAQALWQALKNKKPQINMLTSLNTDTLFNHAYATYGNPKIAYREAQTALKRLQTQTQTSKNLDIRHTDAPHGLDIAVYQQNEPTEFIIFTRDEHNQIQAGLKIRSHKTAANALQTFQQTYDHATPLNTPQGQATIQKTRQQLKQKYGILEE